MQLTRFTDYSIRVLMHLAVHPGKVSIHEIAGTFHLPQNHLIKVVHRLGQLGYVETSRGKGGGLRLARPAEEINLRDVLESTEKSLSLVECFDKETDQCVLSSGCRLKGIFHHAMQAFLEALGSYTLADAVRNRRELQALLS